MAIHPLPLILASTSTYQQSLLAQTNIPFITLANNLNEPTVTNNNPQERVVKLAQAKANLTSQQLNYPALILATDTLIVFNRRALQKPRFKMDAVAILKQLSGKMHAVITGWALLNTYKNTWHTGFCDTFITFRHLTEKEIIDYVNDNPVTQWAGGYNSHQSSAISFIASVKGSLSGLNGLPLDQIVPAIRYEYAHPYKKKLIQE